MTIQQIASMIDEIGIQNAYYQFEDGRELTPPWICFRYPESDDVYADDSNYQAISQLSIELYSAEKDFASEAEVEAVLIAHGLAWAKFESHLQDEHLYLVTYETEVIINAD